jgi:hypothetical protein
MKWLYTLLLSLLAFSCTTTEYVPVETTKTDSIYISQFERDSIYVHDSVYVRDKGDTVYVEKVKYLYREKVRTDTVYTERTDSIRIPYPVERKLGKWEETYLAVGRITLWAVIIIILIVVGSMVYKLFK